MILNTFIFRAIGVAFTRSHHCWRSGGIFLFN
nr:MAG TPA: phosphoprotein [Caudoviricetes sp.]